MIPEFGTREPGREYVERPGAYAVIFDGERESIALIRTSRGYFLPGGGIDPGETPEETLAREVMEECGFTPQDVQALGEAVQYLGTGEGRSYRIHGIFFAARPGPTSGQPRMAGEELVWVPAPAAQALLLRPSAAWAVRQWLESGPAPPAG